MALVLCWYGSLSHHSNVCGVMGLNFTHENAVVSGPDIEDNARLYSICNYRTHDNERYANAHIDVLTPPHDEWEKFRKAGDKKNYTAGWHRFKSKYQEYLVQDDDAHEACQKLKARATVRPIYIYHHYRDRAFSPAGVLIDFIEHSCELPGGE